MDTGQRVRVLDVKTITVTGNDQDGSLSYSIELTAYAIKKPERPAGLEGYSEGPMEGELMGDPAMMEAPPM